MQRNPDIIKNNSTTIPTTTARTAFGAGIVMAGNSLMDQIMRPARPKSIIAEFVEFIGNEDIATRKVLASVCLTKSRASLNELLSELQSRRRQGELDLIVRRRRFDS